MKLHTTNYYNSFIEIAADCPVDKAEVPPSKMDSPSVAVLQYELIAHHPYHYTSDDILFKVYAERNHIAKAQWADARNDFYSRGQPCLRASPLAKRYGWGIHFNSEGKVALYAFDSSEYREWSADPGLKILKAMKSRRQGVYKKQ